jgi:catechol 2,3-dioxygenase-like lactoylglutathione lyase family enzyme
MSNVKQVVPFFWIRDMERSLRFYVDGLGFTMKNKWVDGGKLRWCLLALDDVTVMLQEGKATDDKLGVDVSICFICDDAIELYRQFRARGLDAQRPFVGNAMWVTEVSDPDGHELQFESATDAPEESVYSD